MVVPPGRLPHQQGLCELRLGYRDRASDPNWGLRAHWQALSLRLAEWFFGRAFGLGFGVVKPLGAGESRFICMFITVGPLAFGGCAFLPFSLGPDRQATARVGTRREGSLGCRDTPLPYGDCS